MRREIHRTMSRRSHQKRTIDFLNGSTPFAEALMSSSHKGPWKSEIPLRRRTGAQRRERRAANTHRLVPAPSRPRAGRASSEEKKGMWIIHEYDITEQLDWNIRTRTQTHPSSDPDALLYMYHYQGTTPASRGAGGEGRVTQSGRGIGQSSGGKKRGGWKETDHPPNNSRSDWLIRRLA